MPIYRIPEEQADFLAREYEETAMGYQILDLRPVDRDFELFLALNSEFLIPLESETVLLRELVFLSKQGPYPREWQTYSMELTEGPRNDRYPFTLPSGGIAASLLNPEVEWRKNASDFLAPQNIVGEGRSSGPTAYFRLSAFDNDRRIGPDGEFLPGTYATTYTDIRLVPSGFAAVGRYALPNPHSAKYMYGIVTDTAPTYVGTAVPNYGQAGGGVEVLFSSGAKPLHGQPWEISEA